MIFQREKRFTKMEKLCKLKTKSHDKYSCTNKSVFDNEDPSLNFDEISISSAGGAFLNRLHFAKSTTINDFNLSEGSRSLTRKSASKSKKIRKE